ncbi:MAG: glycosyltransferase family 1 protein [Chloroflexi bacterium]|nr:glycosyltransferase family 1 protein [Chloroflexota bacterium]
MSLRIAIDASRTTAGRPTGTEHYARRLLHAFIEANLYRDEPHNITLYFRDAPPADLFPANAMTRQIVLPWGRAWTHLRFARELWAARPDVCFVPAHTLPLSFPGHALVTVHDLGYKHFPAAHPQMQRRYLDFTTAHSQRRATLILADSRATADDLSSYYGAPKDKIRVLYPGVDADALGFEEKDIARVRDRFQLPERFFLFIGTLQPRNNIQGLVNAFVEWQRQVGDKQTGLVLAGGKGWLFDETWLAGAENVRMLGYIEEGDKGALLSQALALVFPSFYEGFGFPVLEAMICGTPVIASNTSSLPELVGKAGLLVDPQDTAAISSAMRRYNSDPGLRQSMIRKGKRQAAAFTWERAAARLHEIFDEIQQMQ